MPRPALQTPSRPKGGWRRHGGVLVVLAAGVLLAHALLLGAWSPRGMVPETAPTRVLTVRQIAPPVPAAAAALPETATPAATPPAPAARRPFPAPDAAPPAAAVPSTAAVEVPAPAARTVALNAPTTVPTTVPTPPLPDPVPPGPAPVPSPMPLPAEPPAAAGDAAEPVRLLAAAAPQAPAGADAPPTYRTRVPPSAVLQYELRRGALTGAGELRWQRTADDYELSIEGSVFGLQVLSQASRGGFDVAGLAPLRFVDRRRGRDVRAANFQRDRGLITYSGSEARFPLVAGAQDRLSWMVQLAAIVDAEPARFRPGAEVEMSVSGSRGDTDVWTFTVAGREAIDIAGGRVERALALRREPRKPYDTHVDVWLDPARHHLPVRIRLSSDRGVEPLEFVLKP